LYLTSDGTATYPDHGWASLIDANTNLQAAQLFAARTNAGGPIFPGFGLPPNSATLTPSSVSLITGTTWDRLGGFSGNCYGPGCGNTGWVRAQFTVAAAGDHYLAIGTSNSEDTAYDSGIAVDRVTIDDIEVEVGDGVPEPGTTATLLGGLCLCILARRRRR
jgi:hypothetical protein